MVRKNCQLLLKLLENETEPSVKDVDPILSNLDENILSGNSLMSDKDVENIELSVDELVKMSPFDWNSINNGGDCLPSSRHKEAS